MSYIVDRRLNAKNKSAVNRQRFLRRYRQHIKKAVAEAVTRRSITDIDKGEQISIPTRDISEPVFHHGRGGRVNNVLPGNKEFVQGDRIPRPPGGAGAGGGGSGASDSGEGMDDFVFQITQEEFLDFMFEDLELPSWPATRPSKRAAPVLPTKATRGASILCARCAPPMPGAWR